MGLTASMKSLVKPQNPRFDKWQWHGGKLYIRSPLSLLEADALCRYLVGFLEFHPSENIFKKNKNIVDNGENPS